jgi:signal transduction histidine kinase
MALSRRAQRDALAAIAASKDLPPQEQALKLAALKAQMVANVIDGAPTATELRSSIERAPSLEGLSNVVQEANWITIFDTGRGMSLAKLDDAFLTIGTRSKLRTADESDDTYDDGDIVLGEKGIGRLSAMRLGSRLRVETTPEGGKFWNELSIDWSVFDHASEALLEDIPLKPVVTDKLVPPGVSGTKIYVRGLNRDWSREHVEEIAGNDFARLNDPFASSTRFPIILKHNDEIVPIPGLSEWILRHSHGQCEGTFRTLPDGRLSFSGTMASAGKTETFGYNEVQLLTASKASSLDVLREVGPFSFRFHWFNRRNLTALDGVGDLATVRARLAQWTGGLMVYRDGFRVPPYGGPDDDWLDLDRVALSRGGYKLNRAQIVGRVAISSAHNRKLNDQANREGLIDNEEKRALQQLLTHVIQQTYWSFLGRVEASARSAREPVSETLIAQRLANEEERLEANLAELARRVPAIKAEIETMSAIRSGIGAMQSVMEQVRQLAREYEEGRTQLLNLAGVGLTVEILAHELNRATETALDTLQHMPTGQLPTTAEKSLKSLAAQLKTLQKRLKVLDPLSTSGRNRKEKLDIVALVRDVIDSHEEHFGREGVLVSFEVIPAGGRFVATVVRGMVVQVLENLISNSIYWLRQQKRLKPEFESIISVSVNCAERCIVFSDNGPGIPDEDQSNVFDAFYTKRPAGQGKGLGLFISREIAKYHDATLQLERGSDQIYRTFVLDMGNSK